MLISIVHVLKTIELEFPTLVEGTKGSDHRLNLYTGILKYNIKRDIEFTTPMAALLNNCDQQNFLSPKQDFLFCRCLLKLMASYEPAI